MGIALLSAMNVTCSSNEPQEYERIPVDLNGVESFQLASYQDRIDDPAFNLLLHPDFILE